MDSKRSYTLRWHGFTRNEFLTALCALVFLWLVFVSIMPLPNGNRENMKRASCQQNLKHVALAIAQYAADSAGHFPEVRGNASAYGWAEAILPYSKNPQLLQCPSEPVQPPTTPATTLSGGDPAYTDYFYNSRLSGRDKLGLRYPALTIMLGEAVPGDARRHSNGGADAKGGVRLVDARGTPVGAAMRHLDGANYAFADGHVKWLKGKDANTTPALHNAASATYPGFAIR
jgi:prepilin-type processing-associated H-X9-DG protein